MKSCALFLALCLATSVGQAAPFQNLGFDLANTNNLSFDPGPPLHGTGTAQDLLPGWGLSKGGTPQSTLGLNLSLLSLGYATLISADQSQYFGLPVDGAYGLQLVGSAGNQDPFSLSQQGDIPVGAQVLTFRYGGYPFALSINGTTLQPSVQSNGSEAFNVSPFAGQTVNLTLTALGPAMPTEAGSSFIDSVAFAVPEPGTWILLALACPLLCIAVNRQFRASDCPTDHVLHAETKDGGFEAAPRFYHGCITYGTGNHCGAHRVISSRHWRLADGYPGSR